MCLRRMIIAVAGLALALVAPAYGDSRSWCLKIECGDDGCTVEEIACAEEPSTEPSMADLVAEAAQLEIVVAGMNAICWNTDNPPAGCPRPPTEEEMRALALARTLYADYRTLVWDWVNPSLYRIGVEPVLE